MNGANTEVNATFTHTSIGPSRDSTSSAAASTSLYSATSTASGNAWPPASSTSAAAPSRPVSPRASSATAAPRSPYIRATARPIPPLAPVTTTTCRSDTAPPFAPTGPYPLPAGRHAWRRVEPRAGRRAGGVPRAGRPLQRARAPDRSPAGRRQRRRRRGAGGVREGVPGVAAVSGGRAVPALAGADRGERDAQHPPRQAPGPADAGTGRAALRPAGGRRRAGRAGAVG